VNGRRPGTCCARWASRVGSGDAPWILAIEAACKAERGTRRSTTSPTGRSRAGSTADRTDKPLHPRRRHATLGIRPRQHHSRTSFISYSLRYTRICAQDSTPASAPHRSPAPPPHSVCAPAPPAEARTASARPAPGSSRVARWRRFATSSARPTSSKPNHPLRRAVSSGPTAMSRRPARAEPPSTAGGPPRVSTSTAVRSPRANARSTRTRRDREADADEPSG
jgi:hypothetical protein